MSKSIVRTYDGMFAGNLTGKQIVQILRLQEIEVVSALKNMIFNIPVSEIQKSVEQLISYREYAKNNNVDIDQFIAELRDEQTLGTAFLYHSPKSVIGDSVGYGKTVEMAALINILYDKKEMNKFIMAVELTAVGQTQFELIRRTGLNIITLPSEAIELEKVINKIPWERVDGIVISHSTLKNSIFQLFLSRCVEGGKNKVFDVFILDESSIIKNDTTLIHNVIKVINSTCDRVHYMNATLFEMNIFDVYNQIDALDESILPRISEIKKKYCKYEYGSHWIYDKETHKPKMIKSSKLSGYKNQEEFKRSLGLIYFGRHKEAKKNDYRVVEIYPTVEQLLAIKAKYRASEVLNCPSKLDQTELMEKIEFTPEAIPKLAELIKIVKEECEGKKVMIYCFHLDAQEVINKYLTDLGRKCVILNGSIREDDRYDTIKEFNEGDADTIITNIKKSINLYDGDCCIIYSVETNPAKLEQISGRIERHVNNKIKYYIMLLYIGTNEEYLIREKMLNRSNDAKNMVTGAESAINRFLDSYEDSEDNVDGDN